MPGTPTMAATTEPVCAIAHQPPAAPETKTTTAKRTRLSFMPLSFLRPRLFYRGDSLRDDEVDAKLAECRGRRPRIARRAGRGRLPTVEPVGAHHSGIDRHLKRGVGRAGMAADLGV